MNDEERSVSCGSEGTTKALPILFLDGIRGCRLINILTTSISKKTEWEKPNSESAIHHLQSQDISGIDNVEKCSWHLERFWTMGRLLICY
jgi:hypothetical protein